MEHAVERFVDRLHDRLGFHMIDFHRRPELKPDRTAAKKLRPSWPCVVGSFDHAWHHRHAGLAGNQADARRDRLQLAIFRSSAFGE